MDIFTNKDLMPPVLRDNKAANVIMQLSVYLFPVVAVLSSIPVFSIVIKYNMVENGFSHRFSFFWGVIFPWLVALPLLYQPDALNQFITFSSLIFVSCTWLEWHGRLLLTISLTICACYSHRLYCTMGALHCIAAA
jgi:hypothetical protein